MHSEVNPPSLRINCFFVSKRMGDILDEACPPWLLKPILDHVKGCTSCQKLFSEHRLARDVLKELQRQDFPHEKIEALFSRVEKGSPLKAIAMTFAIPKPLKILGEVAAAMAIFIVILFSFPRMKPMLAQVKEYLPSLPFRSKTPEIQPSAFMDYVPTVEDDLVYQVFFAPTRPLLLARIWNPGPREMPQAAAPQTTASSTPPTPSVLPAPPTAKMPEVVAEVSPQPVSSPQASKTEATNKTVQKSSEAQSEASSQGDGFSFYTLTMVTSKTGERIHPEIIKVLEDFKVQKAGKSNFGEVLNGGLYYHFFVNSKQYQELKTRIRSLGQFSEREKSSKTEVPSGQKRVALWVGTSPSP